MKAVPSLNLKVEKKSLVAWICAVLVLAIAAVYWPVAGYSFTGYDDPQYVFNNAQVLNGLSWSGVVWAFDHFHFSNWHPLTWLSHMLDVQLFGLNAGAHHVVNVVFHAANTVLLFLWLRRLTGFLWRSAMVAALFALHPLHVESVAWVAERKDVLSTFFLLLTLMAYTRYAERRKQKGESKKEQLPAFNSKLKIQNSKLNSAFFYLLALFCFALGLMSKPMLVTLPFMLLLLDYCPLRRIANWKPVILEKTPFFLLSAISCVVTFLAQQSGKSVMAITILPVEARIENAMIAYVGYLQKMVWPEGLAACYPLYDPIDTDKAIISAGILLVASAIFFIFRRQQPWLLMGWLWYLGTLVPVIGLVQVGSQSMADRYTYVSLIGLFIAFVWLVAEIKTKWPHRQMALTAISGGVLATCWTLTTAQVRYWQNSETLARRALAVTTDNALMQDLLANALREQGKGQEALQHFAEALRIAPASVIQYCHLAVALAANGKLDEAVVVCRSALKLQPKDAKVHYILGNALLCRGDIPEAIAEYKVSLELESEQVLALNDLAWVLATTPDARLRNGPEAVRLAERACQISNYRTAKYVGTLGAAYAEAGRFNDAVNTAQKAVALATEEQNQALIRKNRELLELYQQGKPYHEPPSR